MLPGREARRKARLRREAADWLARLNGPASPQDRAQFERWYAADPAHAEAYDRIRRRWEEAGALAQTSLGRSRSLPDRRRPGLARPVRYALAVLLAVLLAGSVMLLGARDSAPVDDGRQISGERYAATGGDPRQVLLADGSRIALRPGSEIAVSFTAAERRLHLLRGRARFVVAHGAAPFMVVTPGAEVIARGTVFEVEVGPEGTAVLLVEGLVDVRALPGERGTGTRVRRLRPGERLLVGREPREPVAGQGSAPETAVMLEFDNMPLGEVIELAARHDPRRIRLAGPELMAMRVTGSFRAGDSAGLARSLAAAFDLRVEESPDGALVLRAPPRR